jgi:hypothetical protein
LIAQDHHKHDHEHKPDHKQEAGHKHDHDHHHEDDIPAWKKKALETGNSDPTAAPFGGDWTTEASIAATDETMEE